MEKIILQPTYLKYSKEDFKIYKCRVVEDCENAYLFKNEEISIKGDMSVLNYNMHYNAIGEMEENSYGKTLTVAYINELFKEDDEDFKKKFLMQILTSNQYEELVSTLDDPVKAMREENIELLTSVKGVGNAVAKRLIDKYKASIDYSEAIVKFGALGMSSNMINKIVRAYSSPKMLIEKFDENPYILADDVSGVGFKTADEIALKNGIEELSVDRISAYIINELKSTAQNMGDTYLSTTDIYNDWCDYSGFWDNKDSFKQALLSTINSNETKMLRKGEFICLIRYYNHEQAVAEEIIRLSSKDNMMKINNADNKITQVESEQGFEFNDEQREAILKIVNNNVVVISGSSGTGKSSIARAIVDLVGRGGSVATALSGKAGQRLSETTSISGQTIHRLLMYNPVGGFLINKDSQLDINLVVLDESSMVDIKLFRRLVEGIATGTKLIMLGDTHQLQSIGAGNVLLDLIKSGAIEACELKKIHRQAQKSGIITVATKIRNAEHVIEKGYVGEQIIGELQDFELIVDNKAKTADKRVTADKICNKFKKLLDDGMSIEDIQVIVPMKTRGGASTSKLNDRLQYIYNPSKNGDIELEVGNKYSYKLRVNDKVICRKNNYQTMSIMGENIPVFNGSMGIVKEIDPNKQTMIIDFYGIGKIIIDKGSKSTIELAYAITVHSSQGSQWKHVIVGIDISMFTMLNKELLYTAITRAEIGCTLIAENHALRMATTTSNLHDKKTLLSKMLKKLFKK